MHVLDAIHAASAGPFVQTHHILGIIVADGLEITKLSLPRLLVGKEIGRLYVDYLVSLSPHKVYFLTAGLLAGEYLVMLLGEMQEDGILHQFVDVFLHGKAEMAVAQA